MSSKSLGGEDSLGGIVGPAGQVPLTRELVAKSRSQAPLLASAWTCLVALVVVVAVVVMVVPVSACTASSSCEPAWLDAVFTGLWVASAVAMFIDRWTGVGLGAAAVVLAVPQQMADPLPWWAFALIPGYVGVLVAVAIVRQRHRSAVAAELASGATSTTRNLLTRGRGSWPSAITSGLGLLVAMGLMAAAVAAAGWGWHVQSVEADQEAAAKVVEGTIRALNHDDSTVLVAVPALDSTVTVGVFHTADYPLGSTLPFWLLPDGDVRPVAEPYDASLWGVLAALLAGLSIAVGGRTARRRRGQLALFDRPQPVFAARARRHPNHAEIYSMPVVGQIDHPVLEIALRWVNLDDPREPPAPPRTWATSGDRAENSSGDGGGPGLVDVELIGIPADGHWCAVRHVGTRSLGIPTGVAAGLEPGRRPSRSGRLDRRDLGSGGPARAGPLLIAEDLLLLLNDDTSGRLKTLDAKVAILLAGANLVELALMGRVGISREVKPIRFLGINRTVDRLVVRDPSPTGDAVLDAAVQVAITGEGGRPRRAAVLHPESELSWVIRLSGENLQQTLYERFFSRGMVRHERRRTLMYNFALTKEDRWPVQDSRRQVEVRQRVTQALVAQTTPDPRSAAMIAILHTIRHEPKIVDPRHYGMSKSQLIARGEQIANSNWAPEAVRDSIDTIIAATGTVAASAGEGGGG